MTKIMTTFFTILFISKIVFAQNNKSLDDILKPIMYSDESSIVMELKWKIIFTSKSNDEFLVSIHGGGKNYNAPFTASIYKKNIDGYKQIRYFETNGDGLFLEPNHFLFQSSNSADTVEIIHFSELTYGTGNFIKEHMFSISSTGELSEVEFMPAPKSYKDKLKKGEGIWKGEMNQFSDNGLSFTFHIWNDNDANCCPTAGKVTGSYTIEKIDDNKFKIEASSFQRHNISK
jgi:hypothetical protein